MEKAASVIRLGQTTIDFFDMLHNMRHVDDSGECIDLARCELYIASLI